MSQPSTSVDVGMGVTVDAGSVGVDSVAVVVAVGSSRSGEAKPPSPADNEVARGVASPGSVDIG